MQLSSHVAASCKVHWGLSEKSVIGLTAEVVEEKAARLQSLLVRLKNG